MADRQRKYWEFVVLAAVVALSVPVHALTIPVMNGGTQVGTITVDVDPAPPASPKGVKGEFTSSVGDPPSLAAAAQAMGEHHFNWGQVVLEDNKPPNDASGNPLVPPYLDPPPGGYGPPSAQWADDLPWYWDETQPPDPKPASWEPGYDLGSRTEPNRLDFRDYPWGEEGTKLKFATFLISCNADGSLHSIHEGFVWTWERPASGGDVGPDYNRNIFDGFVPDVGQQIALFDTSGLIQSEWDDIYRLLGPVVEPAIPEPATLSLVGLGLAALARRRRRRAG